MRRPLLVLLILMIFIIAFAGCDVINTLVKQMPGGQATSSAEPTAEPTVPVTQALTPSPTLEPPTPSPSPSPTPTPIPVDLEFPYYIIVDQGAEIVTIYTIDQDGKYTIPVKYMICSTSKRIGKTPIGMFRTKDKYKWRQMYDSEPLYAQYCTRITGSILFHSIPYKKNNPSSMIVIDYNRLGTRDSAGCVRLQVSDAKWIFDNIPKGTPVEMIAGDPAPDLIELLKPADLSGDLSWDPSDPDPSNPIYLAPKDTAPLPTPYPGVTPAPLNTNFSPDLPQATVRLPGMTTAPTDSATTPSDPPVSTDPTTESSTTSE